MPKKKAKDPAAQALGRKGGLKKVPKGLAMLTAEERSAIARQGAEAMWEKRRAAKKKRGAKKKA